jgi:SAM-dependent methyltransferase
VSTRDFRPIADSLRAAVREELRAAGADLANEGTTNTLETNSGLVESRAAPLLEIALELTGRPSLAQLALLDLGCGFGALSVYFAAQGAAVTGVDQNEERMRVGAGIATRYELPARFRYGRMQRLPFPEESFDLIVQNNSLCYVLSRRDRSLAFAEALRVLRPAGWLIIRDPNRWHQIDQFSGIPLIHLLPPGAATRLARLAGRRRSLVRLASPREAKRQLRTAGFVEVAHLPSPSAHWPAFTKPVARYQHLCARRPPDRTSGPPPA